jgi:hypothetical protein
VRKEVQIHFSLGDLITLWESIVFAVRKRKLSILKTWLWLHREHIRRGTWKPWTIGDHIYLVRMRKHMAHWPRETPKPAKWRHR